MTRTQSWLLKYVIATTVTVAVAVVAVRAADAGSRQVNKSWTGPNGSHSVSKNVTGGNGSWNRDVSRTGPQGNIYQRNTQRSYDRGQSATYSKTTTLPSGSTVQRDRSVVNNGDSVTVNRAYAGPQGNTGSVTHTYPKP